MSTIFIPLHLGFSGPGGASYRLDGSNHAKATEKHTFRERGNGLDPLVCSSVRWPSIGIHAKYANRGLQSWAANRRDPNSHHSLQSPATQALPRLDEPVVTNRGRNFRSLWGRTL